MDKSPVEYDELSQQGDDCEVAIAIDRRWYLVVVVGAPLSWISLFSNLLIAKAVLSQKRNHFFFLGLLALSDSFLSFCYGPVIAMDIIKDRLQVPIFIFLLFQKKTKNELDGIIVISF